MIEDITRALNVERRRLHALTTQYSAIPGKPGEVNTRLRAIPMFKAEQVERMLRIEIDRDHEGDWLHALHRVGMIDYGASYWDYEGPRTFQNVDVYMVNRLPAPGWRIVNPMVKS
jgi:hypothetical protein